MLTQKQKEIKRLLISQNPGVEYQEQLENEQFAIAEIKRFSERECIILQRQVDACDLSLRILAIQKQEKEDEKAAIEEQEQQVINQKEELLNKIESLSE